MTLGYRCAIRTTACTTDPNIANAQNQIEG